MAKAVSTKKRLISRFFRFAWYDTHYKFHDVSPERFAARSLFLLDMRRLVVAKAVQFVLCVAVMAKLRWKES